MNEELRSGIINLAFLITKDFQEADLEVHTLLEIPLVLITYPKNSITSKTSVRIIDLKNDPIFVTSSDCGYFKILEKLFANEKIRMPTLYHINSIEAIKLNIIAGTGMALLPKIAVHEELLKGSLVELKF